MDSKIRNLEKGHKIWEIVQQNIVMTSKRVSLVMYENSKSQSQLAR
ncbi:MAG: hypothetical protein IJS99_01195 [Synergistaceae bacterium]|nr:hypothetical protein [Synergistaceae bacterium]